MREAQGGDLRALDALLVRLRPSLLRFFARRLGRDAAEDAAQDALIRIARAFRRIDAEGAGRYIVTVAENLLRWECRRRAREARRSASVKLAERIEAPDTADGRVDYGDLASVCRASAATLPPELQDVVLAVLRGLSPLEIAAECQVNRVTIRTRLLRARARLRAELRLYAWPSRLRDETGSDDGPVCR